MALLIQFLSVLSSGDLVWRESNWLWALLLPIIWWLLKKIGQKQQQQAYADLHLWAWVNAETDGLSTIDSTIPREVKKFKKITFRLHAILKALSIKLKSPSLLLSIAWLCLVIAMAGPKSSLSAPNIKSRAGIDILVAMDLSHSMTATDIYPNRFYFSKSLVETLASKLQVGDRLALQGFAGQSHIVSPLSDDLGLFQHALNLVEPDLLPLQGSWLERSVIGGLTHLSQTAGKAQVMVIFTNGTPKFWQPQTLPNAERASRFATAQSYTDTGIKIILVGIGLLSSTTIPDVEHKSGKLHINGLLVQSRLEESRLKKLAQRLQGVYLRADSGSKFIQRLLKEVTLVAKNRLHNQPYNIWQDYAWPFIFMGFIFLLFAFYGLSLLAVARQEVGALWLKIRQKTTAPFFSVSWLVAGLLLLGLLLSPEQAIAESKIASQHHAYQAYQSTDYDRARALYDQDASYAGWFGAGASAYKIGDVESAVFYFRQAAWEAETKTERAKALFNLGNSYYKVNLLSHAIDSYHQALLYQSDYPKVEHNLEVASWRKAVKNRGKQQSKVHSGKGEGDSGREREGAFYGGQKPSHSNSKEPGFGSDGEAPEGNKSGEMPIIPQESVATHYGLGRTTGYQEFDINKDESPAMAILRQQQRLARARGFEHNLQQLEDDQKILLKRLFEREAGFHAAQTQPHPIPGVQPW